MSFILDALRKSDADRQRTVTPGLADVRYAVRRQRRNLWLPILVVVLAANVVFMGLWWFSRDTKTPAVAEAPAIYVPPASDQPPAMTAPVVEPEPPADIRPLAREAEFGEPQLEAELTRETEPAPLPLPETAPQVTAMAALPPELPTVVPTPPMPTPSRILAGNDLPTAEQLIGSGVLKTPMLNLDLHVYSETAAQRFVIINSRKYKEGGQLAEGPQVETINPEGVILTIAGRRFTLSRK
jgi:general secretion pathway protein B